MDHGDHGGYGHGGDHGFGGDHGHGHGGGHEHHGGHHGHHGHHHGIGGHHGHGSHAYGDPHHAVNNAIGHQTGHSVQAPFGELVNGLEAGLGYSAVGAGWSHGQTPIGDSMADAIAIAAAHSHGGHGRMGGYQTGSLSQVPAFAGDAGEADGGRVVNLPGIARTAKYVEVGYWPHSECEPMDEVRRLALRMGMADPRIVHINSIRRIDKKVEWVMSNTPYGDDDDVLNPPNGWYRGATGSTHLWRDFFQLTPSRWATKGTTDHWLVVAGLTLILGVVFGFSLVKVAAFLALGYFGVPWLFGKNGFANWRTFLVVSGCTWYYKETGDYETRVAFSVYSAPLLLCDKWTSRWDEIARHRERAEILAHKLLKFLQARPADASAIEKRRKMKPCDTEPNVPGPKVPIPFTTSDPLPMTGTPDILQEDPDDDHEDDHLEK